MKKYWFVLLGTLLIKSVNSQNIIAQWHYNTITGSPLTYNSDLGSGTSSIVGSMVVAASATGMDPIIGNGCGAQNGTNPGAWSFTANPGASNESSGVQYNASTVGQQNIRFSWDQRWSGTSANTVRLQYTLDGTVWNNFTMDNTNTTFCNGSLDQGRFQNNGVGDQYRRIIVNFTGIPAVNNNANFGVRLLAAHYQTTGQFRQTINPTLAATAGTWRFDNVMIEGLADVSIASASNFAQYNENIGLINVPITVANANSAAINLTFSLSTYSDATPLEDYTWNGTISIPAGTNGVTNLPISIIDDMIAEKAERIVVKIASGTNANISATNNYQIIFIKDNDLQAPTPTNELNLTLLSSYSNGASGTNSAEIVAFDPTVDRLYIANSIAGKLDIVNFSNPSAPVTIASIPLSAYGNINSVTVHDSIVALAIESVPAQTNGKVVFLDYNGNFINQVTVGAMPDMICFNQNYTKILTANEGEPDATYANDPEGSVSIIDLTPGYASLTNANVTQISLTSFNGQAASLNAQGIRIFSTSASVAQDLEPEYIAISSDNTKAYVSMQENNALLTIDLTTNTILSLAPFGYSSYDGPSGNAMDASDQSGAVLITGNLPIKGAYMPDAMQFHSISGMNYLITANEGDSREFGSVIDANRLSSATFNNVLDATAFPDQNILRNNKFLGRLSVLKYSGDTDGDGDYDQLHSMGGRSFSIWNANTGALVYDSKSLIEQITALHPTFGSIFNASNTLGAPALKNRSDDKGPEPEGITVANIYGSHYAFVSLERIGGVMIFNINNPTNPVFVGYANNRSTTLSGPDLGAEGIIYISQQDSPNGKPLVILANEISATLSIYQVNTCAEVSGSPISLVSDTICSGQTSLIAATSTNNVNYQWLLNGNPLTGSTNPSLSANQTGTYALLLNNTNLGCTDTSNNVSLAVLNLPNVSGGNNLEVCIGGSVTLNGTGALNYSWTSGVINNQSFSPLTTQSYQVTGTDAFGCQSTAQVQVIVNSLPNVSAGTDTTICASSPITLVAQGATSYSWSNGVLNGNVANFSSTTTLSVTGVDVNGCSNTDQVTFTVLPLPIVDAGLDTAVCLGQGVVLNGSGGSLYNWSNGVPNGTVFTPDSTINLILTATAPNGCSANDSLEILVQANPEVQLGSDIQICASQTPYEVTSVTSQDVNTYTWSNGDTTSNTSAISSGLIVLEVSNGSGCSAIDSIDVNVVANPTVSLPSDTLICQSQFPYTITAVNSIGSTLNWYDGSSAVTNSLTDPGTYSVVALNPEGCSASDTIIITSDPCLSTEDISEITLVAYPNPFTNEIQLINNHSEPMLVQLYQTDGKLILESYCNSGLNILSTTNISVGQYILKSSLAGKQFINKLIKE